MPLSTAMTVATFKERYFLKTDLQAFCRRVGLSAAGCKADLNRRIIAYLTTGKVPSKQGIQRKQPARVAHPTMISRETPVTTAYRCNQQTRTFFKKVIGDHFHFTAHLQQWRRAQEAAGKSFTYGDLADEWEAEYERKKQPGYKSNIQPEWQYNQFTRDFHADANNQQKAQGITAAQAWNVIKETPGEKSYAAYKQLIAQQEQTKKNA